MREVRAPDGRFASTGGVRKLRVAGPSSPYEVLAFDRDWRLIGPLNEWYRLRKTRGSARTRDSYLAMLCPFLGFLIEHRYAWNAEPDLVREYARQYLTASGCVVRRAWQSDGYHVALRSERSESVHRRGARLLRHINRRRVERASEALDSVLRSSQSDVLGTAFALEARAPPGTRSCRGGGHFRHARRTARGKRTEAGWLRPSEARRVEPAGCAGRRSDEGADCGGDSLNERPRHALR